MNKHRVIVVEGRHDQARLSAIDPSLHIITTQGSAISQETLDRLVKINKINPIIVLTDPDSPGEKIRHTITEHVGPTQHIFLKKEDCISKSGKKVGVEHASTPVLKAALKNVLYSNVSRETMTQKEFNALGLNGTNQASKLREKVSAHFNIGTCNAKTMLKRLNMFGISLDAVKQVLL